MRPASERMERGGGPVLRVLLFSTVFPNAAQPHHGVFVRERMRGLPADVEVRVIAPAPWFPLVSGLRPGFRPAIPREEVQDGVRVLHPRFLSFPGFLKSLDGILMFLCTLPTLFRLRRELPFQVIDAHFAYPEGLAAALAGLILRVPVTITLRGTLPQLAVFRLRRPQLRFALRRAARVIAVAESLKADAVALGIPAEKVRVIENGIDPELFRPVDRTEARRALGLPKYGPLLVSVGTLSERKGFHLVLEAMAKLRVRWPTLRFAIVGGDGAEGAMEGGLRQLAARLKIADRVVFAGTAKRGELAAWYGAADLSVLASALEGCPNVVLEALACGTPVVGTPVGNVPELLDSPEVGIVVERTVDALAAGIDAALGRGWDRERVRARVAARSWRVVGEEQAEELRAAAGSHTPSPALPRKREREEDSSGAGSSASLSRLRGRAGEGALSQESRP